MSRIETVAETPESLAGLASVNPPEKKLTVTGLHDFLAMELPTREQILSPWLLSQSLNMIHGWRGKGKTHVAVGVGYAVASASSFLNWQAEKPHKVLLVDGEMPAIALQERLSQIIISNDREPENGFLTLVTPDLQEAGMPDLASSSGQSVVNTAIDQTGAELVILDNLSCLVRGTEKENDASSWVKLQTWALQQRQAGRSILFIHHSGKSGQQRGTSKREDVLDTVLALRSPPDYDPESGACFEVHFEKARHLFGTDVSPFEARLTTDANGLQSWACRSANLATFDRVVALANEGLSQSEIANELELNRSTVSRAWRKADQQNLLAIKASRKGKNQHKNGEIFNG
jgi:hypothetical protein